MKSLRFALARVTIEATTPLTVGTGGGVDVWDSACVTDASGLPAIPGSSLAGALRARYAPAYAEAVDSLFGFQESKNGEASRVAVSWAAVHGANDRPVAPRMARDDRARAEPVLSYLISGTARDHVALNGAGVPDGAKKYDELLVPVGARFTFELRVDANPKGGDGPMKELEALMGILAAEGFRLGGRTRRGYGAVRVERWSAREFDLSRKADRDAWVRLPRALDVEVPAGVLEVKRPPGRVTTGEVKAGTLRLTPLDYWLFGGSDAVRPAHVRAGKPLAMLPKTEARIVWRNGNGSVEQDETRPNLVPATSVKGALSHRVAFHARRAGKRWLGEGESSPVGEVETLFGRINNQDDSGRPGVVFLSDAYVETAASGDRDGKKPRDGVLDHVSLDRYTQGPMDGMLFQEAPLHGGEISIPIAVVTAGVDDAARCALSAALTDLCEGRLALGAGSNRGHGYFKGKIEGELKTWLAGGGTDA